MGAVLIVDDRHDVLELNRILLEAEGYEAVGCSYAEATPERLRRQAPRVLLLDLVPGDEAPWTLLQQLRQDESTREIGVVVTSDAPVLVDRALADPELGIAAGLAMPFDIEALYGAIATAARHGRKAVRASPPILLLQRAADAVRQGRGRIVLRWVQRISALDAFRRRPDLALAEMQGRGEELIAGVADALALQATTRAVPTTAAGVCLETAREHARLRCAQGLQASDVAREVVALRREVWREVRSATAQDPPPLEEVWDLLGRLHLALDESLFAMLETLEESMAS
jgi:two-component system phosphate regulon response regulator PhoB